MEKVKLLFSQLIEYFKKQKVKEPVQTDLEKSNEPSLSTSSTTSINQWSEPFHLETNELEDSIEIIYEETSNMILSIYPSKPPEKRHFKIVFSCVDGKWNKSEKIYAKKIEGFSYF